MFDFLHRTTSWYLPIFGHVKDDVVLLDDGSVFGMLEVTGSPWETADVRDVVGRHIRLNHTYKNIAGNAITVSVYQCRSEAGQDIYPTGRFSARFAADLDAAYRHNLFSNTMYDNRTFIGVQVGPNQYVNEVVGESIGEFIALHKKPATESDPDRVERLDSIISLLRSELRQYKPRLIGVRLKNRLVYSEIAEVLVFAMTGRWRQIPVTTGRLGNAMFSEDFAIGRDYIKYIMPGGVWYGAMFGMHSFPAWTHPGMFSRLLAAPYASTIYHSYRFISMVAASRIMRRKRSRFASSEDEAIDQAEALKVASQGILGAEWVFGDYSFSFLTFADSERSLDVVATEAWENLADSGMVVSRESKALEAGLFSMVPGNAYLRPRPGYITSLNFAAMAPLHAFPDGEEEGYWGKPVAMFRTMGGTPYRFHLHVDDVGNTFICGRVGSGKTTLIGFLIAMADRKDSTVVAWDKDRGLKVLIEAMGGTYLELRNPTGLAPLKALTNSVEDIEFLSQLIRGCIMSDGGKGFTPEEDRRLSIALNMVMTIIPPHQRSMSEVRSFLGVSPDGIGARLDKWCAGKEYGWVVDNDEDCISLDARVIGFDQTFILDNAMARGAVMSTLYHYVDKLIDGRRLLFVIDEFWKSLLDPAFRSLVNDKLRTLRKRNSPMILATQSPKDALVSAISHTIRDQCPTQIYFSNSHATWEDFGENGMGLTRAEFDIVRSLPSGTGEFLLKQGRYSVRAQLPLGGMDDYIAVLSGREATTRIWNQTKNLEEFHRLRKEAAT